MPLFIECVENEITLGELCGVAAPGLGRVHAACVEIGKACQVSHVRYRVSWVWRLVAGSRQ